MCGFFSKFVIKYNTQPLGSDVTMLWHSMKSPWFTICSELWVLYRDDHLGKFYQISTRKEFKVQYFNLKTLLHINVYFISVLLVNFLWSKLNIMTTIKYIHSPTRMVTYYEVSGFLISLYSFSLRGARQEKRRALPSVFLSTSFPPKFHRNKLWWVGLKKIAGDTLFSNSFNIVTKWSPL